MATISFAALDQSFSIDDAAVTEFSAISGVGPGIEYSYASTGGDDWEFDGTGITNAGAGPTGGTVDGVFVDLDDDSGATVFEVAITGLGGVAATSFGVGVGTAAEQNNDFWLAALSGVDTFDFNLANFAVTLTFAGDGANIADGGLHLGTSETFSDPGSALGGISLITGDYFNIQSGVAVGGDDIFTLGARALVGDWLNVDVGATGIGGDDRIAPARLDGNLSISFVASGDANAIGGALVGGDDLIDLRNTDLTGYAFASTTLIGDAFIVVGTGALIAGNDTVHGSSINDVIFGEYTSNNGYIEGGKDRLFGYGGNDTISGNEGRDQLFGGDGDDSLNGGLDGDIIDGGIGNDNMTGDTGNDIMTGGDGNDTMIAGSGSDTVDGGIGDDAADAGAGADVMIGGTGKDGLFGGTGNDSISGDAGNDTLQGGDNNDTMLGGAGFDLLLGGNDNDFLDGGASNDILFGNAGVDTFNFAIGGGTDTIRDMVAGVGLNDVIRLEGFGTAFDTFAEVMAAATDNGTDTTINFGGGNVLIIQNVTVAQFNTDDFIFG